LDETKASSSTTSRALLESSPLESRLLRVRRLLLLVLAGSATLLAAVFGGAATSGALFLLLPSDTPSGQHDLPDSYEPLHKGHVDLGSGLYIRHDEDLIVRGTPPLVLRRTYLSGYRVRKEFGVGTTNNGEWYLIGDPDRFQWASLILDDGSRINFERISAGSSYLNAMYEHRATPTKFQGGRLGWTGLGWAMRLRDGSLARFQACGPDPSRRCALVQTRDSEGHTINYRRTASGRLSRMEASADRWIAFDYDVENRITHAYDSTRRDVWYEYDASGRLSRVRTSEGKIRRYGYTDRDEMQLISDPDITIENSYDASGRCIRQVNRFPGEEPYTFDFGYRGDGRAIVQTDVMRSDGTWSRYTFGETHYATSETWGRGQSDPASFTYERDPLTNVVTALTVTCPDRTGRPLRHSSQVTPDREAWIKWDLLETHCSWSDRGRRRRTVKGSAGMQDFEPR
jgi:YD repeat-containing protein